MPKILVNCPNGMQQIIIIDKTGDYFDNARVIWDERTDGALPSITLGGMVRQGDTLVFDQPTKGAHDAVLAAIQAEEDRIAALEQEVKDDSIINNIKSMTPGEYDTWWSANVTNLSEAGNVLKRLVRVVITRLL